MPRPSTKEERGFGSIWSGLIPLRDPKEEMKRMKINQSRECLELSINGVKHDDLRNRLNMNDVYVSQETAQKIVDLLNALGAKGICAIPGKEYILDEVRHKCPGIGEEQEFVEMVDHLWRSIKIYKMKPKLEKKLHEIRTQILKENRIP